MPRVVRFDDGYHTLKPTILGIVKDIYKALDPKHVPIAFDACYHFVLLSYEPPAEGALDTSPGRVYIIMYEGEPGSVAMPRFVLNGLSGKVHDRHTHKFEDVPEITGKLEIVKSFVRKIVEDDAAKAKAFALEFGLEVQEVTASS